MMNRDHRRLDVQYIGDLIKPLISAEVIISVVAIQVAIAIHGDHTPALTGRSS